MTSDPRAGWLMRPCQLRDQHIQRPPPKTQRRGLETGNRVSVLEGGATGPHPGATVKASVQCTQRCRETPSNRESKDAEGCGGGHTVRPGVALLPNTSSPMRCPSCSPVKHFPKYCQGGRQVRGRSCNPAWHHRTSGRWVPCSERPAGPLQTRRPGSAPGV